MNIPFLGIMGIELAMSGRTERTRVGVWLTIFLLAFGVLSGPVVVAQEPVLAFLEGLRQKGYYDTAIEYLDSQNLRPDLPQEIRDVIDLQRGMTLQQAGSASRVPDDRSKLLSEAEVALQKFLSGHPQHPQAAQANSLLGELLFDRAESLIWETAEKPTPEERAPLQNEARALIDQAKGIFQAAHDQYKSQYEGFPKFVDESKDEELFQQRKEAEGKYLRAWLNLVRCTYERGQTFDRGTEERRQTLNQAAGLFEAIHTSRRTNTNGLYARLMEGKCFQEQDDIGRALGIYNEILDHKSDQPFMQSLKGTAKHFRLICLNDPQRNDFDLVIQEAGAWLQANRQQSTTEYGLGILWEQAIAEEKRAQTRELPAKEKLDVLQFALNHAEQVAKYPGAFREPALSMSRRLKVVLGEKDREPRDFATAFERAWGMIAQIQELTDELSRAADDSERSAKKAALDNHLNEVGRLLRLALALREADSDAKAVAQSRYLLSFVMLKQGNPLDAVVLATNSMSKDQRTDPDTALNSTEIAMAAAVAAWNMAPGEDRDFETRLLRDVCQQILALYPQSSRGGEARMRLGSVYRTMQQPMEAVKWFLEVPETDPQYASARISAGQSYWAAWTREAALAGVDPGVARTAPEELLRWKTEARSLLQQGIQLTRQKAGDMVPPSEELVAAEVSLASIMNMDGEFQATIDRLTAHGENSVVAAIEVPEGTARPETGAQSRSFAGLAYRLLLRAWIGTQQIDQALQTMTQLEKVGGDDILTAYTQLGMELQEELKRLQAAGEVERLAQVRTSFEQFLQKVYESRNKSDYNSLLWIGETYYGLGLGVTADASGAEGYFEKAGNAYSEILSERLVAAEGRNAVLLRLARCRRKQSQFAEALKQAEEILAQNAMNLDAQFEAALILGDWGEKSEPDRLNQAIQGLKDASGKPTAVWGWGTLSKRLQQIIMKDPKSEFRPRFFDARYELSLSRRRIARVATDKAAGTAQLKSALAEINSVVQAFRDLDDVTFARFDRLYQDIQADLGESPSPLTKASPATAEKPPEVAQVASEPEAGTASAGGVAAQAPGQASTGGSSLLFTVVTVAVSLLVAGGLFFMMRKPKQRVRIPGSTGAQKISLDVPEASGFSFPQGLDVAAPELANFSVLEGIAIPGGRSGKAGTSARPAARPAAGVRSSGVAADRKIGESADLAPAKPRSKPVEGVTPADVGKPVVPKSPGVGVRPPASGAAPRSRPPAAPGAGQSPSPGTASGDPAAGKKRSSETPPE
ncbi:MAG: hypothetical protein WCK86_13595 [Planctomycetia bacterium]